MVQSLLIGALMFKFIDFLFIRYHVSPPWVCGYYYFFVKIIYYVKCIMYRTSFPML